MGNSSNGRTRRRLLAAFGGLAVVASLMSGTASAQPKPDGPQAPLPGGFGTANELLAMQAKLNAAADRIVAAKGAGFSGIVAAPENRELHVYWAGDAGEIRGLLAELNREVPVKVLPAAYSEKALEAAAEQVKQQAGVRSVAPKVDGSGLSVAVDSAVRTQALTSSVPVEQTVAAPSPISRVNDSPPYWGGARWGGCSTGFAVWHAGVTKMLTAAHCGSNGQSAYDGGGDYMGVIQHDDDAWDTMLIDVRSAGRIWDGGVGSGEFTKPVDHAANNYVNNRICTSGSYSGAVCDMIVRQVNVDVNIGYWVNDQVMAEQFVGVGGVGNGDSGGPVFDLVPDQTRVIAKGTLTAIDLNTAAPCTGVPAGPGRNCAWRFFYANIGLTLPRLGASIVTG